MKRAAPIMLVVVALAGFGLAARWNGRLLGMRRELHLNWDEPLENSPPLVSFTTVALGGFRGMVADLLWLRVARLQEEKKYFELVQLADWITKLEPRFAMVWAFHAWNMAYNVSVTLNAPEDRWRWVENGIRLLRDEGMKYNPGDPRLYHELGWFFEHKLAGNLDQAHGYYKQAWAAEMMELFDGPHPDYAAAARNPGDPRVQRLRQAYKLVPALMQRVDAEYGPLDWRLPQAHAIYWAWRGKPFASGFDAVQLDRMIFQSMQDAFWQGRLVYDRAEGVFMPVQNLELLPRVRKAYEQALAAHPEEESIQTGYRNFLGAAILALYENHRLADAQELFGELRRRYFRAGAAPGLEQFVAGMFEEKIQSLSQSEAQSLVEDLLYQSYFWVALGEEERGLGMMQLAALHWQRYMAAKADPELRARTGLPPFEQIRQHALRRALAAVRSAAARQRLEAADRAERAGAAAKPEPSP